MVFSPQNYSSTQEDLELRSKQVIGERSTASVAVFGKGSDFEGFSDRLTKMPSETCVLVLHCSFFAKSKQFA